MTAVVRIDAHQHYWEPRRGDYAWMPMDDPVLARTYLPRDLEPELEALEISKTVIVQAAPSVEETEYLLGIADTTPSVAAVVGWINFEDRTHLKHLERLKRHPKFVGVRPMIQDIADIDWMLRLDVQWAFAALSDLDLSFDALGYSRHLPNFLTIFERYPRLRAVVDHCMKPPMPGHGLEPAAFAAWAEGMADIAGRTGAFCKLSGLVTEAGEDWTVEELEPYAEHVLSVFGPSRVMWGSDWPVCRVRSTYGEWFSAARALCAEVPEAGRAEIFGGTAARFYRLGV